MYKYYCKKFNYMSKNNLSSNIIKLNTPLISLTDKAFFLKKYVSEHTIVHFDGKNNILKLDIDNKKADNLQDKLMNRVGDYLKNGNITLGNIQLNNISKPDALNELKTLIDRINIQFDMYVRSNHNLVSKINSSIENGKQSFDDFYKKDLIEYINNGIDNETINDDINISNNLNSFSPNLNSYLESENQQFIMNGIHKDCLPHKYQLDFVNLCRTRLLWSNAYDVGLGKTITSLVTIQDQQNNKLKNKTIFVVPNSTLSNWYKESFIGNYKKGKMVKSPVYSDDIEAECLFINLIDNASYKSKSNNDKLKTRLKNKGSLYDYLELSIDEQIKLIANDKYKKIFITHDNFYRIKMKTSSFDNYINYLKKVDNYFDISEFSESNTYKKTLDSYKNIICESHHGKTKEDIYLEDLNIDSIVIDELHVYKNAKDATFTNGFSRIKYLSTPPASALAVDMLAKTNYIRENNIKKDGILGLTATPITNSPLELYSILSLIIGEEKINEVLSINSINDFLTLFCLIEVDDDYSVTGNITTYNVFKGINNLPILRELLFRSIIFLTYTDSNVNIDIKVPDYKKIDFMIGMSKFQKETINNYKNAYFHSNIYKEVFKNNVMGDVHKIRNSENYRNFILPVLNKFHEDEVILSSPFNFITKMERLILDEDLNEKATIFFISKEYKNIIEKTVKIFNKNKFKYKSFYLNPHTDKESIISLIPKSEEFNKDIYELEIKAKVIDLENETDKKYNDIFAYLLTNKNNNIDFDEDLMVVLDSTDYHDQLCLFDILCSEFLKDKSVKKINNITLNKNTARNLVSTVIKFNISNKIQTLINNIKDELNNPRGKTYLNEDTDIVKQLIFCDQLGLHFKIKILIHQNFNIDLDKIEILTGQYNNENENVQAIQDNFNAEDDDNKYQFIIANRKAEVGINLQNGTQAIHHLTIGWTPDSKIQRNGRAIRQGNNTEYINVYDYYMEKTFDSYKSNLVSNKNNWIQNVIDRDGSDYIYLNQTISKEQQEKMIEFLGENQSIEEYSKKIEEENRNKEINNVKNKQKIYLNFLKNIDQDSKEYTECEFIQYWMGQLNDSLTSRNIEIKNFFKNIQDSKYNIINENLLNKAQKQHNKLIYDLFKTTFCYENLINKDTLNEIIDIYLPQNIYFYKVEDDNCTTISLFDIKVKRALKSILLANNYIEDLIYNKLIYINIDFNKLIYINTYIKQFQSNKNYDKFLDLLNNFKEPLDCDTEDFLTLKYFVFNYVFSSLNSINYYIDNNIIKNCFLSRDGEYIKKLFKDYDINPLKIEIEDINVLNKNIIDMATDGYKMLTKDNQFSYYPLDIITNNIYEVEDIISYSENLILSIGGKCDDINSFDMNDFIYDLKEILECNKSHIESQSFYKSDLVLNHFLKNKVYLTFVGNDKCVSKFYPIDNKIKFLPYNINIYSQNKPFHIQFDAINAGNNKEDFKNKFNSNFKNSDDVFYKHFEIYHNNEEIYSLLLEAISFMEYYYLNRIQLSNSLLYSNTRNILIDKFDKYHFGFSNFECFRNEKYNRNYINDYINNDTKEKILSIINYSKNDE